MWCIIKRISWAVMCWFRKKTVTRIYGTRNIILPCVLLTPMVFYTCVKCMGSPSGMSGNYRQVMGLPYAWYITHTHSSSDVLLCHKDICPWKHSNGLRYSGLKMPHFKVLMQFRTYPDLNLGGEVSKWMEFTATLNTNGSLMKPSIYIFPTNYAHDSRTVLFRNYTF